MFNEFLGVLKIAGPLPKLGKHRIHKPLQIDSVISFFLGPHQANSCQRGIPYLKRPTKHSLLIRRVPPGVTIGGFDNGPLFFRSIGCDHGTLIALLSGA